MLWKYLLKMCILPMCPNFSGGHPAVYKEFNSIWHLFRQIYKYCLQNKYLFKERRIILSINCVNNYIFSFFNKCPKFEMLLCQVQIDWNL